MRRLPLELYRQVAPRNALPKDSAIVPLSFKNGRNGVYTLPCQRIAFTFALNHPASVAVRDFVDRNLPTLAKLYPSVEFDIQPINGGKCAHARASYDFGPDKLAHLHNMQDSQQIQSSILSLLTRTGLKPRRFRCGVDSDAPAIRPIWSPFHDDRTNKLTQYIDAMAKERSIRRQRISEAQTRNQELFNPQTSKKSEEKKVPLVQ